MITELMMIKTKILLFGCFPSFWKRLGRQVFRSAGTGSAISSHIRTHAMNDTESLSVLKKFLGSGVFMSTTSLTLLAQKNF